MAAELGMSTEWDSEASEIATREVRRLLVGLPWGAWTRERSHLDDAISAHIREPADRKQRHTLAPRGTR